MSSKVCNTISKTVIRTDRIGRNPPSIWTSGHSLTFLPTPKRLTKAITPNYIDFALVMMPTLKTTQIAMSNGMFCLVPLIDSRWSMIKISFMCSSAHCYTDSQVWQQIQRDFLSSLLYVMLSYEYSCKAKKEIGGEGEGGE